MPVESSADLADAAARQRARRRRKNLLGLILLPPLLFVFFRWFEHAQVYHPTATHWATPAQLGLPWEEAYFSAADGVALHGWFFPADTNSPRRHLAVLHCHGNGGNISHRLDVAEALLETGVNVLLFDYRGYGRSAGRPSEAGTYLDAQAAHAWLRGRGFAATNLIAFGESLGGAVATELALREPLGALVLQSTFTSIPDIGAELFPFLPVRWLARIRYDTHSKLPRVTLPVVILHSRRDTLVRFHHAERNFAVAREPKRLLEIAGDHNDFLEAGRAEFVAGFAECLRLLSAGPDSGVR
ncbi:MAG: alpha/beta hydrolase [Verrucomicrobia bacterium]|jgi:fermentation-respiration switch protein FrsA (DUF1100 family)|nr:alpha/beta hydrolase [Verrucomicrobiota bacterium]